MFFSAPQRSGIVERGRHPSKHKELLRDIQPLRLSLAWRAGAAAAELPPPPPPPPPPPRSVGTPACGSAAFELPPEELYLEAVPDDAALGEVAPEELLEEDVFGHGDDMGQAAYCSASGGPEPDGALAPSQLAERGDFVEDEPEDDVFDYGGDQGEVAYF